MPPSCLDGRAPVASGFADLHRLVGPCEDFLVFSGEQEGQRMADGECPQRGATGAEFDCFSGRIFRGQMR